MLLVLLHSFTLLLLHTRLLARSLARSHTFIHSFAHSFTPSLSFTRQEPALPFSFSLSCSLLPTAHLLSIVSCLTVCFLAGWWKCDVCVARRAFLWHRVLLFGFNGYSVGLYSHAYTWMWWARGIGLRYSWKLTIYVCAYVDEWMFNGDRFCMRVFVYVCSFMHVYTTKNTHIEIHMGTRLYGCVILLIGNKIKIRLSIGCLYQSNTRAQVATMHCDTMLNRQYGSFCAFGARFFSTTTPPTTMMMIQPKWIFQIVCEIDSYWNFYENLVRLENLIIFMWVQC